MLFVCLFAVKEEVGSSPPPRFGQKFHQVTTGVGGLDSQAMVLTPLFLSRREVYPGDFAPAIGSPWETKITVQSIGTPRISAGGRLAGKP